MISMISMIEVNPKDTVCKFLMALGKSAKQNIVPILNVDRKGLKGLSIVDDERNMTRKLWK